MTDIEKLADGVDVPEAIDWYAIWDLEPWEVTEKVSEAMAFIERHCAPLSREVIAVEALREHLDSLRPESTAVVIEPGPRWRTQAEREIVALAQRLAIQGGEAQ